MLRTAIVLSGLLCTGPAFAQGIYRQSPSTGVYSGYGSNPGSHAVQGYTTQQGAYVAPHMQTNPNMMQTDNYGARGNTNPYNGAYGTRTPEW